jgi:hypothetical protein
VDVMQVATVFERPTDRADEFVASTTEVRFLDVPTHRFVMIDGEGPPVPEAFAARTPALYAAVYGLRASLGARGVEAPVAPLEGLWWTPDGPEDLGRILGGGRETWRWTLMIALPEEATPEELDTQLAVARHRVDLELAASLRAEELGEGPSAQVLHVGPYAQERPTIERLHRAIAAAGLQPVGRHHELYVADPSRCAPERLRTVVRQPVR